MDNNTDFKYIISDIYLLFYIGKQYSDCAKKLLEENNQPEFLYSFCLLSTNALELFLKVIIAIDFCIDTKNTENNIKDLKERVIDKLKKYGHDIEKMINDSGIKDEFKIKKIQKFSNSFLNEYRIEFLNNNLLCFKDSESVRFGSFAKFQDVSVSFTPNFNKNIVDFLEKLSEFAFLKFSNSVNILKSK